MKKLGDPAIALTVVACSIVLFLALAFALNGNPFDHPARTLRAVLPDITGIAPSSAVKYAGAMAGTVHSVRMLTPEERIASGNSDNAVEITIAINNNVPTLSQGLSASVSSDTLLSEKFLLLSGGDPKAPALQNGALISAIPPTTFDAILRDLGGALAKFKQIFGGAGGQFEGILPKVDKLMDDLNATVAKADALIGGGNGLIANANTLVDNGDGLVRNADEFIGDGKALINDNKETIKRMIAQLSTAADSLDDLAKRADKIIKDNEGNINSAAKDAKDALSELKEVAVATHALVNSLRARPQQLLWGPGRTPKPTN
jgi:ABC-type transporter Mla subunit MlaD